MSNKEIICPERKRRLPEGFGWIDHRLVRENIIDNHSCEALALYLFLLTVGDEDGVSWYSDASVCRRLNLSPEKLKAVRRELTDGFLIAYRRPHYQILELPRREGDNAFRHALSEAVRTGGSGTEKHRRQPAGTEGMGVSLYPQNGIYQRPPEACDALPLKTIIDAMAGGEK